MQFQQIRVLIKYRCQISSIFVSRMKINGYLLLVAVVVKCVLTSVAGTVWPRAWLKPGEEAEVFIAMRPVKKDEHLSVPRPTLITPVKKARP